MKNATVLATLAIGVAAIGISIAPSAAAAPSNCQTVGAATVCGQGGIRSGSQSAAPSGPVSGQVSGGGGCTTPYGTYQNCNMGR